MQERNLCSQGKPYQFLCSEGMLHRNQKEIEGPNIKILSMKKRSIVDAQLLEPLLTRTKVDFPWISFIHLL